MSNSNITRADVELYYKAFLDRAPESEASIRSFLQYEDKTQLAKLFAGSQEFYNRVGPLREISDDQVFKGYSSTDLRVFDYFPKIQSVGVPGFALNFLGVKIRTKFQAPLAPYSGVVEGYPVPTGGLQGETAEFIGALRSVLDAEGTYCILECGAGYGPWLGITAAAARLRGIEKLRLYGVEGDEGHVVFMREHMEDCAIAESECELIHGAVGAESGIARWAVVDDAAAVYGGRPMGVSDVDYLGEKQSRTVEVRMHAIEELLGRESKWDLVHLDIQGGEGAVCRAGIEEMSRRVKRVVVGTHSRALDGEVMTTFETAGWVLENEKPTVMVWRPQASTLESMTRVDGAQVWRNPTLLPFSII